MSQLPSIRLKAVSVLLCTAVMFSASPLAAQETAQEAAGEQSMDPVMVEPAAQASPEAVAGVIDAPTDEAQKKVFDAFRARLPGVPIESLSESAYPGLYEIITDSQIIYVDETATLLFQGDLIDLASGTNLTEARLTGLHIGLINDIGEENMLIYKPEKASDRSITVFTDINCGYCRLLHGEIDTLLDAGVSVRYLMFPRAGLESESRTALESVWCADDPQAAMTSAKAGNPIQQIKCKTPIEQHYALAEQVGLRGTPLIYLDNGTAIPGYREAKILVEMINSSEPSTN